MKTTNNRLRGQDNNAVSRLLQSFKVIFFNTINKKQFYLFLILISVLASCKKEVKQIAPNDQESVSQVKTVTCDAAERMQQQLVSDPEMKSRMIAMETDVQQRIKNHVELRSASVITIPVVVHVVYNLDAQNIPDAQIQSQIDVLNKDFNAQNIDIGNVPAPFVPLIGNANFQFVLAKRDPNGNATNGITRTHSSITSFSSDGSVCYSSMGGYDAWPTTQYMNIWVCNKTGAAGYSSYPWSGVSATDGIIMNYNYFGTTGAFATTYGLKGRTATHEAGHWFGLGHIWGDATCGDDLVSDTPIQEKADGYGCVFPHISACGNGPNGDMFMDYMDYTDDATRIMFSQGQVNRMNGYLQGTRAGLLTSLGATAPSTTTTVCNIPGGLNVNSITTTGSTLNWISTGAASYNVRYKATTSTTWITASTSSTSFAISGLNSSTNYEFQVASVCSGTSSSAFSSSILFTTTTITIICNVPAGLNATLITKNSATLNWSSSGAVSYKVRYKSTSSATWINVSTASLSLAISGLSSSTNYEFQVASVCSGSALSNYSASMLYTTNSVRKLKVA